MVGKRLLSGILGAVGFMVLAGAVILAYGPSLGHGPRGDQINYLAEISLRHGWMDTVWGTFDLNRTRVFGPGDELAFRPLLYVILGIQKYFFGYNFMAWQAFTLAAHLLACGALLALLWRIRGGLFAFLGTAFFAFAIVNIEAVTWHHISPYLLFAACVLMALRDLYMMEQEPEKASAHALAAVLWMTPSVFLYETGVWYAVCMGGFLWIRKQRRAAFLLGALVVVYAGANVADLWLRHTSVSLQAGKITGHVSFLLTLKNAVLLGKWFLSAILFLAPADLTLVSRMMVSPDLLDWTWPWGKLSGWTLWTGVLSACVASAILIRSLAAGGLRKGGAMLGLCYMMAAGYLVVIALGRINVLGVFGMRVGLYYAYNFLILACVIVALIAPEFPVWKGLSGRIFKGLCVCVLGGVIVYNALMVRQVVAQMARDHHRSVVFLTALDRYVRAHEKESDFSFYVGPEYPGNYTPDWVFRQGDPQGRLYTVAEALYPSQFRHRDPKYVIKF